MSESTLRQLARRAAAALAAAGLLAAALVLQADASRVTSAVVDEPAHVTAGYLSLVRGDLRINREHPPLLKALAALPLLWVDPELPPVAADGPEPGTEDFEFDYSRRFLYRANLADRLLAAARLPMLALTMLLGAFIFVWTREIAGPGAALVATFLYALEPNILGHGRLVTTDLGASVFVVATVWALRHAVRGGSLVAAGGCAFFLGCALLSKFSALLLLPAGAGLVILDRWLARRGAPARAGLAGASPRGSRRIPSRRLALICGAILLGGWLLLLAGYGFGGFPLPRLYLEGLELARFKNAVVEGPTYLMGSISSDGFLSYYLIALLVKIPLPLLLLGGLGAAAGLTLPHLRREAVWILLPASLWFVAMTLMTRAQIGVRYVFPVIPLGCIAAGIGAAFLWNARAFAPGTAGGTGPATHPGKRTGATLRLVARSLLVAFLLWHGAGAARIHPYHLAYFNEMAGGPDHGWRWLVDSNLDWGQDLIGLRDWLEEEGWPPVNLYYFGTADPDHYAIPRRPYGRPEPGLFAVSATHLAGVYLPDRDYLADLRPLEPLARIGHSIFVYRLEEVPPRLRRPLTR